MSRYHKGKYRNGLRAAVLVGMAGLGGAATAAFGQAPADPAFETFVVPREPAPAPTVKPGASGATGEPSKRESALDERRRLAGAKNRLSANANLTFFSGVSDLHVNMTGEVDGRQVDSHFTPLRW